MKQLQILTAAVLLVLAGAIQSSTVQAASAKDQAGGNGEFDGASFTCLNYTNGLGENATNKMQSMLAHLWMHGYLAAYYKGKGTLHLSDNKQDADVLAALMLQRCRDFPSTSIRAVAQQKIANEEHVLPTVTNVDFSLATYNCGQHVDARDGNAGDVNKADLAELWAFAFIQGYNNVTAPDMVILTENKAPVINVLNKSCRANRDMTFLDMVGLLATKIKLQ